MKRTIFLTVAFFLFIIPFSKIFAQNNWFSMPSFWEVGDPYNGFYTYNIESFDLNKDGHLDLISGNWNDTYVFFGGYGILDSTVDVTYKGRMLAICDYNGDGMKDLVSMHFTNFDSSRFDYDGELLFYMGSDTTAIAIDTTADYSIPLPTLYPAAEQFTTGYFTVGIQKGDLNGDGKIDLVFTSANSVDSIGIHSRGKIYIYMGNEIPSDTTDFMLIGNNVRSYMGDFVRVGDINGDGYSDLLFSSNQPRTVGIAYDSVNYLHIFYGSENFTARLGNESELYTSYVNPPDSTAGWFLREFSVNDINGDGIDDIVIGRSSYNYPHQTAVHYGNLNGIDTIPSFTFIQDTTNPEFFSAGGIMQDVGDYNMDGYDDFIMSPAGYKQFALHFGGPYVNNGNKYGARGYIKAGDVFPRKAVNMGDQTNDGVNDIAVIGGGYILMLYGQDIPTENKDDKFRPLKINLFQNYPNPFNPTTTIRFDIPERTNIELIVYNILGQRVRTLISNEEKNPGSYEVSFNGSSLASGVYIYRLVTKNYSQSRKMLLVK